MYFISLEKSFSKYILCRCKKFLFKFHNSITVSVLGCSFVCSFFLSFSQIEVWLFGVSFFFDWLVGLSVDLFVCITLEKCKDPAIPLLGTYLKKPETLKWKDIYLHIFIAAPFTITKIWKQPKCPSVDEWIKK